MDNAHTPTPSVTPTPTTLQQGMTAASSSTGPSSTPVSRSAPATACSSPIATTSALPVSAPSRVHPLPSTVHNGYDGSTVHLYNVPAAVTDGYLLDLCSRWGSVASISRQVTKLAPGFLEIIIVYHQQKDAEEALRHLDGGSLFGSGLRAQLRSSVVSQHLQTFAKTASPNEKAQQAAGGPRNLYVLNLSLEMTNEELERLFSVFGQVTHVCIMAVLDNLGRRRAFVDMATGESARQAIASLNGTSVHGYRVDVSFAIVQRSGGPVTDYPPTARKRAQQASIHMSRNSTAHSGLQSASAFYRHHLLAASPMPTTPEMGNRAMAPYYASAPFNGSTHSMPFQSYDAMHPAPWTARQPLSGSQQIPQTSFQQLDLYVANLDPVAIVDDDDLANLFRPYGTVVSSQLAFSPTGLPLGVGVVRMSTSQEAELARTQVQGKVMDGRRLAVTFSPPLGSPNLGSPYSPYGASTSLASSSHPGYPPSPYMTNMVAGPGSATPYNPYTYQSLEGAMSGLGIGSPAGDYRYPAYGQTYPGQIYQTPAVSTPSRSRASPYVNSSPETTLTQSSGYAETPTHSRQMSADTTASSSGAHESNSLGLDINGSTGKLSSETGEKVRPLTVRNVTPDRDNGGVPATAEQATPLVGKAEQSNGKGLQRSLTESPMTDGKTGRDASKSATLIQTRGLGRSLSVGGA